MIIIPSLSSENCKEFWVEFGFLGGGVWFLSAVPVGCAFG
jgi:hypothetical protein